MHKETTPEVFIGTSYDVINRDTVEMLLHSITSDSVIKAGFDSKEFTPDYINDYIKNILSN